MSAELFFLHDLANIARTWLLVQCEVIVAELEISEGYPRLHVLDLELRVS